MSITETGDTPKQRKKPGPKNLAEQAAMGTYHNTKFRPEFIELVVEWGKQGKSKAWMCAEMDINPITIQEWERLHPQFAAAITRAMIHSQRWWEDQAQDNIKNPVFKADLWSRNMAARFRNDWTESKHVTNEDGPNKAKASEQDNRRVRELIERLGPALAQSGAGTEATRSSEDEFPVLRKGN